MQALSVTYDSFVGFSFSWTAVTDSVGTIVERRSFDAWGNLRNPITWSGTPNRPPKFDRGFTGHEHLFAFGLINMNGRMYDPVLSSFLSPDNYMQDPTSQQGFNRYAYCMYNPLKYVDPSGELYFGWNGNSSYYDEQASRLVMSIRFNNYLESMQMTRKRIDNFSNSLWSQGDSYGGAIGENGCHGGGSGNLGSPGGGGDGKTTSTKNYNEKQLKKALNNAKRGICVFGALGSMNTCWGDDIIGETAKDWIRKENDYYNQTGKHGYETGNILEFIPWNPDGKYNNYEVEYIGFDDVYDCMEDGYIVAALCDIENGFAYNHNFINDFHYVNVNSCTMYSNNSIYIDFYDLPTNSFMIPYRSNVNNYFDPSNYNFLDGLNFIKIKFLP